MASKRTDRLTRFDAVLEQYRGRLGKIALMYAGKESDDLGSHSMLWDDGMVGGSASYLALVPELEIGVVMLTNTTKSLDSIGDHLMSELVKLKEDQLQQQKSDS